jgi:large subunit ribosomal protein L25
MAELVFNAEVRNKVGKETSKKLRAKKLVPAVVYGKDMTPVHCSLAKAEVEKLRKANRNTLIELNLAGEKHTVLVREAQKHPITSEYEHVDFQAVHMDKPVKVNVDLEYVGSPVGKKQGGIFTVLVKSVKIECLPEKIPQVITLNIDALDAGDSLHVSDIKADNFKIITNPKIAICQVSQVKDEEEAAATTTAATPAAAPAAAAPAADKKAK